VRFDEQVRPSSAPDSIRLLGQEPSQPYRVVALVSVTSDAGLEGRDYGRLTWQIARRAADLGGHAVLLGPESISQTAERSVLTGRVLVFDGAVPDAPFVARRGSGMTAWLAAWLIVGTAGAIVGAIGAASQ
jgi:hypothetical protein